MTTWIVRLRAPRSYFVRPRASPYNTVVKRARNVVSSNDTKQL